MITLHPDAQFAIIFLPMFTMSGPMLMGAVVLVDVVGVIRGWQMFGHAAHLGGAFFGLAYGLLGIPAYERACKALHGATR
jgi:rhomboid-like protein